ncbi:MAG: hypothetical protein V1659_04130 [Candidatus Woesearchaeota archaeon]
MKHEHTNGHTRRRCLAVALLCSGVIYAGVVHIKFENTQPCADNTPEIRMVDLIRSAACDGLYLTVTERREFKDNQRQIVFFDYGFDSNLDEVRIRQHKRKEYTTTDQAELKKWQPLFEEMRSRRFGKPEDLEERF